MNIEITEAQDDAEIEACFAVMAQLRPHLAADAFVPRVQRMRADGFHLVALREAGRPVSACAGYRVLDQLAHGRVLYVDDLVTDTAARSLGHGAALIEWLTVRASADGCDALQLDSGTHRRDAHRFYHREGLTISSFHFTKPLK